MTAVASEMLDKIAPAWVAAAAELGHPYKNATGQVGQARVTYADLRGYIDVAKAILAKHGLAFLQQSSEATGAVVVSTLLLHSSGQWISSGGLRVPSSQNNAQQTGSATTYARRYCLAMFLGMASDDDDGAAASQSPPNASEQRKPSVIHERPLTAAERGPLIELAVAAGYTAQQAQSTIRKLDRSKVADFKAHCETKAAS